MRIAGYTYSFASLLDKREIDTAGVVRFYGTLGVKGVEITGGYVRAEEVPAVQKALADTGIVVACYNAVCDVATTDAAARRARATAFAGDELGRAARLGAKNVLVIPGALRPDVPHEAARDWFAEALRQCSPPADEPGLTLMVANVGWQPVVYGTSEQVLAICAAVGPRLRVTFDVGNFLLAGEDNMQALARVAPRLTHVHFKDWKVMPAATPHAYPGTDGRYYLGEVLGKGVLNLPEAVRRLRELNYPGWVSVEYEGVGEPHEAAREGVAYLKSLLK
jgi:sugar phosphate isomerase/epimerase